MPFQYTFRADDISTWDADTRDLLENRDRELELYSTTIDNSFLNLNASNLTSGTVPSARMTGAYTGITDVGTLGSLTVTGDLTVDTNTLRVDSANNRVGINVTSPTSSLDLVGNQVIRNAATQDGIQLAGRAGGTTSLTVKLIPTTLTTNRTLTMPNVDGTVITTGNLSDITSVGTLASGSIPATLLTGTVASARLSGSYTGITQLGTISPSLTVTGGTGTTITAIANALITGSDNNSAIYLGGNTGSNATGGIEASWRGAGNPTIAVGVTRENNGTKTLWEYTNRIDSYAGGTLRTRVDSNGLTVTAGSLYMSGSTNTALTFANTPDTALPWMQGPVLQGQTGWAFYSVVNGSYRMGYRNTSNGAQNYAWVNDSTMFGTSPDDSRNQATINIVGGTAWFNAMGAGTGATVQNSFGFLVYVSSRRELKENIVAVSSTDGLDRILALRPVEFTMKPEYVLKANEYTPFDVKRGFIAQETAEVDHIYGQWGWVNENQMMATDSAIKGELPLEEATPIYWNHDAIIADLVASIQNINARLQQLETT